MYAEYKYDFEIAGKELTGHAISSFLYILLSQSGWNVFILILVNQFVKGTPSKV